jgi:hypothetical protein
LGVLVDFANRIADSNDVVFRSEKLCHDTCYRSRKLTVGLVGEYLD